MEVIFASQKLQDLCENDQKLFKKFGDQKLVWGIIGRIKQMVDAEDLLTIKKFIKTNLHPLKGERKGQLAVDVIDRRCPRRIVLRTQNGEDVTKDFLNNDKFKTVTKIEILEIVDYHD